MRFNYSILELISILDCEIRGVEMNRELVNIHFDTRLFENGEDALFLCLQGKRSGADFVQTAYDKGCRVFMIDRNFSPALLPDTTYIVVQDVLSALQKLAQVHREKFKFPVIGITGSFGKTIIKEWLNHFLKDDYNVIRSPKSYNSQLGVALSVLQINENHDLAIFEAGISKVGEMNSLAEMIQPTLGLFTGLGSAHDDGFHNRDEKLEEKGKLFKNCEKTISEHYEFPKTVNSHWKNIAVQKGNQETVFTVPEYGTFSAPFTENHKIHNLCAVLQTLKNINFPKDKIQERIADLPQVTMRMEVLQGKNGNIIVNDSYGLESFEEALSFLKDVAGNKSILVFIGLNQLYADVEIRLRKILENQRVSKYFFVSEQLNSPDILSFEAAKRELLRHENAAILFKGQHGSGIAKLIASLVLRSHPTTLEISRQALRNNLTFFKKQLRGDTKLMVMVKAAAYGVGANEMALFLEKEGVDYLGVAFPDEGVNLRKSGVTLPILVMNTHEAAFADVIQYNLEPAIFSVKQLDAFTSELIRFGKAKYPIHLKIETGMNRLGFREEDIHALKNYLISQPEIVVKSIYSHLAESGNSDRSYTMMQLRRFENAFQELQSVVPHTVFKHICNTDGIINYPEAHYDMVRLGIGLLGYAKLNGLEPALTMQTRISKVNRIKQGESLGYDRSFVARHDMKIAVLPIGYADGFHRAFGNQQGIVFIDNQKCEILGNVCMDMCFANVTHVNCAENDEVELLGKNINVGDWARWMNTIPYEIITGISTRVNRIWVD